MVHYYVSGSYGKCCLFVKTPKRKHSSVTPHKKIFKTSGTQEAFNEANKERVASARLKIFFFFCLSDRKKGHMVYWLDVLFLLVKAVSLFLRSFCLIRFTLKTMVYLHIKYSLKN